ncbi:hypothetical protein GGX14DRAFT_613428 [Mycena pura]|uniref:Uncharacterized protein n=1 Tax=Mycena pura TaxID=153505 RepID=A0AAD6YSV8_9AGAR|nr:hypothetical protein GGX14DRAFT_613428 [Mycena pura]
MALSATTRRLTLCTDDGRDIVPPQLPFFPSSSPTSRLPSRAPSPMSIAVHLTHGRKKVRPLPRIPIPPTPRSAPPAPKQLSQNRDNASASMRPLPCLPGPGSGGFSISVTPATPLPPPTPTQSRRTDAHLAPPCVRRGPSRHASLSLKIETIPDAADLGAFGSRSQSPVTPTLPEPPSPRTAQRIRNSKLRRHLGESVQFVLDCGLDRPSSDAHTEGVNHDVLARLRRQEQGKNEDALAGYPRFALETVLDLRPEPDSDTSSDTSSESDEGDRDRVDMDYFCPLPPRTSRKWIRERGQQRWTEDDFPQILRDLRNL